MAPRPAKRNPRKVGQQDLVLKNERKRPQVIKKEQPQPPSRRSARLQRTAFKNTNTEPKLPLPSLTRNSLGKEFPQAGERGRKRKRSQEPEGPSSPAPSEPFRKQHRRSPSDQGATSDINDNKTNPIAYWNEEGRWPREYFKQDDQTRRDLEKYKGIPWVTEMGLNHLLARKKSTEAGSGTLSPTTPSDQKPREAKSAPYMRSSYETILMTKGSVMKESDLGITDTSESLCRLLLEKEQTVPQDSIFRDDVFQKACRKLQGRNEARVLQDITRLIVPSAETLATYGTTHLDSLIESVSEGWNSALPFCGPRPQPDYSVGFGRSAFTDEQLEKLQPFVGEVACTLKSYFMATWQMYFPFLTCEVKCGAATLEVADRQNAHSMTVAVRGVVELFRIVKREKELNREILAFSVSHDHRTVRIYGHYPIIDGEKTSFYRHPIHDFSLTALDGKEKWTAYKLTKNVYDIWMPSHLKRICSAIVALPNFEVSQQSEIGGSHNLSELSIQDALSLVEEADSQSSRVGDVAPEPSASRRGERGAFKKRKRKGLA